MKSNFMDRGVLNFMMTPFCYRVYIFLLVLWPTDPITGQVRNNVNNQSSQTISFECTDCNLEIYPTPADFTAGQEGKVIIMTRPDDNSYHSDLYQQEDGKLIIKAVMPAYCAGRMVYFKVIDPDDQSPYEADTDPNDNLDMNPQAGTLGGTQTFMTQASEGNFNNEIKAIAQAELTITDRYSGDNYQVLASLDQSFPEGETVESMEFIAWKRLYVELDLMYRYGATLVSAHSPDNDSNDDWLLVDNIEDFSVGQQITLFRADMPSTSVVTVLEKKTQNGTKMIRIDDLDTYYPKWSGIRINGLEFTVNFSNELIEQGFGTNPTGDDCGAFVEFPVWDYGESSFVPKYEVFADNATALQYKQIWFSKYLDNENAIYVLGAINHSIPTASNVILQAYAAPNVNTTIYFEETFPILNRKIAIADVINHELGHHLNIINMNHPSSHYHNTPGGETCSTSSSSILDDCVMTYSRHQHDGISKFDNEQEKTENCHFFMRQAELPR